MFPQASWLDPRAPNPAWSEAASTGYVWKTTLCEM